MSDPKVSGTMSPMQKNAMMQAQHVSQRRHAHDKIYEARDYAVSQGWDLAELAVVVIDSEDSWMDRATYEKYNGNAFSVQLNKRSALYEALKRFGMPPERSGLSWEPSAQAWINDEGRAVTDFAPRRPYLGVAKTVLEPPCEDHFLVVTFTRNSVEFVEMHFEKASLEDDPNLPLPVVNVPEFTPVNDDTPVPLARTSSEG